MRYSIVVILAILTCAFVRSAFAQDKPNVILILADDLGYGDLSSYGATDMETPHIDALMETGMRFDNFYANCPVCSPTRAALLTGRYPDLVGVPGVIRTRRDNNWGRLDPNAVLIPEVMNKAGYYTALVGKWHLGLESPNTPNDHGFDFFHGWLGDMMDDYYEHRRHGINYMRRNAEVIDPEGHATDLFTDWAIDVIEKRENTPEPFFLYLAYNAPHSPIQPPEDWFQRVLEREDGISEKRAKIVALIEHMDEGIGRVVQAVEETGQAGDTLIVFTSDNGGALNHGGTNGNLRDGKGDMYEGGIRVPACAVWPGHIDAGSRSDRVALTMDLYPTIAEAAGAEFDHEIEGRSILDTLTGRDAGPDDRNLVWVRREGGGYNGRVYYAIRQGDWKLLQNSPFEPMELYNLEEDPLEQEPLPRSHEKYRELYNALRDHVNETGVLPWQREE